MIKEKDFELSKNVNRNSLLLNSSYSGNDRVGSEVLFDNLPEIIKPNMLASYLDVSIKTIYDWNYRAKTRNIPSDLFLKINRLLYIRKTVLQRWINSQNKELNNVH